MYESLAKAFNLCRPNIFTPAWLSPCRWGQLPYSMEEKEIIKGEGPSWLCIPVPANMKHEVKIYKFVRAPGPKTFSCTVLIWEYSWENGTAANSTRFQKVCYLCFWGSVLGPGFLKKIGKHRARQSKSPIWNINLENESAAFESQRVKKNPFEDTTCWHVIHDNGHLQFHL